MHDTATFAGGCFWCLEAVFERLQGVDDVVSGYTGGRVPDPSYAAVCTGLTGHAEAIQFRFDPAVIGYHDLVELFFAFHDPTTRNRQGPDIGTQYRSAIFVHSAEQRAVAEAVVAGLTREGVFDAPIVTEIAEAGPFYPAEPGHQQYYQRNAGQPYCQAMIAPKISKLRAKYAGRLKTG
jgi:peptide-methionine (S)-S-oxide reductase